MNSSSLQPPLRLARFIVPDLSRRGEGERLEFSTLSASIVIRESVVRAVSTSEVCSFAFLVTVSSGKSAQGSARSN